MQRSSLRKSIALAAGVALMAGTGPALGVPVPAGTALPAADPVPVAEAAAVVEYTSPKHVFTLDDVIGNALGETDADNPMVIKDGDGENFSTSARTPSSAKTEGILYPINSEFGFDVTDFVGASPKTFDDIAEEGWAGEFTDDDGSGLQFSDAETATMKAQNLVGTWAAGLGGNEIKASTEHFTVMEAVMSCAQTIEYDYWASLDDYQEGADPVSAQRDAERVCLEQRPAEPGHRRHCRRTRSPTLVPNEDNIIPNTTDLYLGTNYSVTEKDDGKVLYRWGQAVKRPTDIRFTTTLPLPEDWASVPAGEKGFKVTKAELVLKHAVTNNPNDQIRPEDWENEGATGLTPEWKLDGKNWVSTKDCYEGDGDFIPAGTVLRRPGPRHPWSTVQ